MRLFYNISLSVVIPVYHDWQALENCLLSLERQGNGLISEILIINNSDVPQPSGFRLPLMAKYFQELSPGSYAARNRGIAEAQGEVLVFLDADCVPAPGWLQAGIDCLQSHPDVDLVAGNIELTFATPQLSPAECFEKAFAFRQQQNVANGVAVTANLFVRRRVFEEVGPFNAELMSGGDFEWTRRATSRGHRLLYCAEAVVRHPARASLSALAGKARRVTSGSQALYRERGRLGNVRRVLGNLLGDVAMLLTRQDMTWRERAWALLVLVYLKGVKVAQRCRLMVPGAERRGLPR